MEESKETHCIEERKNPRTNQTVGVANFVQKKEKSLVVCAIYWRLHPTACKIKVIPPKVKLGLAYTMQSNTYSQLIKFLQMKYIYCHFPAILYMKKTYISIPGKLRFYKLLSKHVLDFNFLNTTRKLSMSN